MAAQIEPLLEGERRVLRLRDLGKAAHHEWGWVITEFHEFVALDKSGERLILLVAGQD